MTVAVFFGGKSCEHDISIITGVQACNVLKGAHKVVPIYINAQGQWIYWDKFCDISVFKDKSKIKGKLVSLRPSDNRLYSHKGKKLFGIDACVLCTHGVNGEDGTLQGLLQLSGIAYTGSNTRASALSMDKIAMKDVLRANGVNVLDYRGIFKTQYLQDKSEILSSLDGKLPLIVKPANLGSSIGISIAQSMQELEQAIAVAFEWDSRIIIEHALVDFVECNCAVIGSRDSETIASEIEQPKGWVEFLKFEDKYLGYQGKASTKTMPANLDIAIRRDMQAIAKRVFELLDCSGVARVDFLLKDDNIYVNEINTIPGSLSNYLFAYDKMSFDTLLSKLINIAIQDKDTRDKLKYVYNSNVLSDIHGIKK